jgi:glutathione peroxidase
MRLIKVTVLIAVTMGIVAFLSRKLTRDKKPQEVSGNIYDFKIRGLDGKEVDFSKFKDKALLIVNTASKCGYTGQYADLEKLHEQYGDQVTVLGFPANNFLWQESGSNEEIRIKRRDCRILSAELWCLLPDVRKNFRQGK